MGRSTAPDMRGEYQEPAREPGQKAARNQGPLETPVYVGENLSEEDLSRWYNDWNSVACFFSVTQLQYIRQYLPLSQTPIVVIYYDNIIMISFGSVVSPST